MFSVEYVGRYKRKDSATEIDIEVEDIDKAELMEDEGRLTKIANYIIDNHARKTHNRDFSAMFCVDSVKSLIKYYDLFKKLKHAGRHNLNVATIFSYGVNEEDADANGLISYLPKEGDFPLSMAAEPEKEFLTSPGNPHSREKLDEYIRDYNQVFGTSFSTQTTVDFYSYYNDISKKLKDRERKPENTDNRIDILLVVNMFLTGFDAKKVNTLYVDKNLKFHGLIQAYSRTNRILGEAKSQGNIVVFRNLKAATDEAITLFSNKEAIEVIIMKPYEDYVSKMNDTFGKLLAIVPTVDSVNELVSEDDELAFIEAFRDLIRIKNIISSFSDFKWNDLQISEQTFEDYKSKYLDLYDKTKRQKEKVSILDDVDFELELIHRDEINVAYILQLLIKLKSKSQKDTSKAEREIFNLLGTESTLRSKRALIEKFIQENLPAIDDPNEIKACFEKYWDDQQQKAFQLLVTEESLSAEKTERLIESYLFAEREPLREEILDLIDGEKPGLLQRKKLGDRILQKIKVFIETFIHGMNLE